MYKLHNYHKLYFASNKGKRSNTLAQWKSSGIQHADLNMLYDTTYAPCQACDNCGHTFCKYKKCLDHDHLSGWFTQVLCFRCNVKDSWKRFKIVDGNVIHRLSEADAEKY